MMWRAADTTCWWQPHAHVPLAPTCQEVMGQEAVHPAVTTVSLEQLTFRPVRVLWLGEIGALTKGLLPMGGHRPIVRPKLKKTSA